MCLLYTGTQQQRKCASSPFLLLFSCCCCCCCCCLLLRNELTEYSDRQQFLRSRFHFFLSDLKLYLVSICKVSVTSYVMSELSPIPVLKSERLNVVPTHNAGVTCHLGLREKTLDSEAHWSNKHSTQQRASSPLLLLYNCCRCRCCWLRCNVWLNTHAAKSSSPMLLAVQYCSDLPYLRQQYL